jgi:hypothetical protein
MGRALLDFQFKLYVFAKRCSFRGRSQSATPAKVFNMFRKSYLPPLPADLAGAVSVHEREKVGALAGDEGELLAAAARVP